MVIDGIRRLLDEHPQVERESVRVRFVRLGASTLDVDVFAYLFAGDWKIFSRLRSNCCSGSRKSSIVQERASRFRRR